jgi:hypothetical protein
MNKEVTIFFGSHALQVAGWYSAGDWNTSKPAEIELTYIRYNEVNILPLLQSMPLGFDCIEAIENGAIYRIQNE